MASPFDISPFDMIRIRGNLLDETEVIKNLGDLIRGIEHKTGQATQLSVQVGSDRYVVGDVTKREGEYRLQLQETYRSYSDNKDQRVPFLDLVGSYASFVAVETALAQTRKGTTSRDTVDELASELAGRRISSVSVNTPVSPTPYLELLGDADTGYSVVGLTQGRGSNNVSIPVGTIIFPLLEDFEKVAIQKISFPTPFS